MSRVKPEKPTTFRVLQGQSTMLRSMLRSIFPAAMHRRRFGTAQSAWICVDFARILIVAQ